MNIPYRLKAKLTQADFKVLKASTDVGVLTAYLRKQGHNATVRVKSNNKRGVILSVSYKAPVTAKAAADVHA